MRLNSLTMHELAKPCFVPQPRSINYKGRESLRLSRHRPSQSHAGELNLTSFIEVEDEHKNLLFTLAFSDAITIKAEHKGQRRTRPKNSSG